MKRVNIADFFSGSKAFFVAIQDYMPPTKLLSTPVRDVTRISGILQAQHGFDIQPVEGEKQGYSNPLINPTKNDFLGFFRGIRVEDEDRVVVYIACHGIPTDNQDEPAGYLLPVDTKQGYEDTFIKMSELMSVINEWDCKHLLIILDCCYAGSFRWAEIHDSRAQEMPKSVYFERFIQYTRSRAWQVITSSAHNQRAIDSLRLGQREENGKALHSPFAIELIRALEAGEADQAFGAVPKDGIITASELAFYLGQRIANSLFNAKVKIADRQVPMLFPLRNHQRGEFVFFNPKETGQDGSLLLRPKINDNPYMGFKSYGRGEAGIFYGRKRVLEDGWMVGDHQYPSLLKLLDQYELLIVTGPSGIGKSSLVSAGLLPLLTDLYFIPPAIRPGTNPLEQHREELEAIAKSEQVHLVFIDQYEELVTNAANPADRESFEKLVRALLPRHKVIITLRADFEPSFKNSFFYTDAARYYRFVTPGFSREEIRSIVLQPAVQELLEFVADGINSKTAEEFSDKIIDEAYQSPGYLPMLSLALSELYDRKFESDLLETEYVAFGGMIGILDAKATSLFHSFDLEPLKQRLFRYLIFRTISFESGSIAKKRVYTAKKVNGVIVNELAFANPLLATLIQEVLAQLTDVARLFISDSDASGNTFVEPAHDVLLRSWTLLNEWLNVTSADFVTEQGKINLHNELNNISLRYLAEQDTDIRQGLLWDNKPQLKLATEQLTERLNAFELDFVNTSLQLQRRKVRRRNFAVSTAFIIITMLAAFGWNQANVSKRENNRNRALYLNSASLSMSPTERLQYLMKADSLAPGESIIESGLTELYNDTSELFPFAKKAVYSAGVLGRFVSDNESGTFLNIGDSSLVIRDSSLLVKKKITDVGRIAMAGFLPGGGYYYVTRNNKMYFFDNSGTSQVTYNFSGLVKTPVHPSPELFINPMDLKVLPGSHDVLLVAQRTNRQTANLLLIRFTTAGKMLRTEEIEHSGLQGGFLCYLNPALHELYVYDSKELLIYNYKSGSHEIKNLQVQIPPSKSLIVSNDVPVFTFSPDGQKFWYQPFKGFTATLKRKGGHAELVAMPANDICYLSAGRLLVARDSSLYLLDDNLNLLRKRKFNAPVNYLLASAGKNLLFAGKLGEGGAILDTFLNVRLALDKSYNIGQADLAPDNKLLLLSQNNSYYEFDLNRKNEAFQVPVMSYFRSFKSQPIILTWDYIGSKLAFVNAFNKRTLIRKFPDTLKNVVLSADETEVIALTPRKLIALDRSGKEKWTRPNPYGNQSMSTTFVMMKVNGRNKLVYSTGYRVMIDDPETGKRDSLSYPDIIIRVLPDGTKGIVLVSNKNLVRYVDSTGHQNGFYQAPQLNGLAFQMNAALSYEHGSLFYFRDNGRYFIYRNQGAKIDSGYFKNNNSAGSGLANFHNGKYLYHVSDFISSAYTNRFRNELWTLEGQHLYDYNASEYMEASFYDDNSILFQLQRKQKVYRKFTPVGVMEQLKGLKIISNLNLDNGR